MEELRPLVFSRVRTGDRYSLEIREEASTEEVLAISLRGKAKVISLNPVKMSLEDYFMAKVSAANLASTVPLGTYEG